MKGTRLLLGLIISALLFLPINSYAANVILNKFGYLYETGGFPTSEAGDVLAGAGVVTSANPSINCDIGGSELTWVVRDLVSEGQISPDGGVTIYVSYTGGTIGLYCDSQGNHDWGVSPPNATAPSTFEDGSPLLIGSFTQFRMFYNTALQIGAFQGWVNFTNGTDLVSLPAPNGFIFAGTIGPDLDINVPYGYSLGESVGQIIAPALCTVLGNVSTTTGTNVEGVTVDAEDGESGLFSMRTDEFGNYVFSDVAAGDIAVSIVVPLGYTAVTPTDVLGTCGAGDTLIVNFVLEQAPLVDHARTIGFWKHQVNSALMGKQNGVQVPVDELLGLFEAIHNRFDQYFDIFVPVQTLEDFRDVLTTKNNVTMLDKARTQFAAFLLNVVSGRLATWQVISDDGATVSQAITYISDLMTDGDGSNDEIAKDIADTVNNGKSVGAGVVPLGTIQIAYTPPAEINKEAAVPELLGNVSSYPNPFNANATISYELGREVPVTLTIYNIRGQKVRVLVNGAVQSGLNHAQWDGKDSAGRNLASGVYFYRVEAGDQLVTRRMIIIR